MANNAEADLDKEERRECRLCVIDPLNFLWWTVESSKAHCHHVEKHHKSAESWEPRVVNYLDDPLPYW